VSKHEKKLELAGKRREAAAALHAEAVALRAEGVSAPWPMCLPPGVSYPTIAETELQLLKIYVSNLKQVKNMNMQRAAAERRAASRADNREKAAEAMEKYKKIMQMAKDARDLKAKSGAPAPGPTSQSSGNKPAATSSKVAGPN